MLIGLTLATDELRMCMTHLTMAASLIMIESANNGSVSAWPALKLYLCTEERDEILSIIWPEHQSITRTAYA